MTKTILDTIAAAAMAMTALVSVKAGELPTADEAASNREYLAELYAFGGQSLDTPCDNLSFSDPPWVADRPSPPAST